ncbi:hypothetical protein NE237_027944 [Protea cynaroides]|uniref:Uncharacterized protein n=1 Tax=Protea cynaroides TaxID=273540 RepID=A0A9Q0GNE4_9MAGN|nr:hypothetical protein NE237_027944 [Protea cynaroides]
MRFSTYKILLPFASSAAFLTRLGPNHIIGSLETFVFLSFCYIVATFVFMAPRQWPKHGDTKLPKLIPGMFPYSNMLYFCTRYFRPLGMGTFYSFELSLPFPITDLFGLISLDSFHFDCGQNYHIEQKLQLN